MDVEKFILEKGVFPVRLVCPIYEKGLYVGYRYPNDNENVDLRPYDWRYIYDGFEFIGGSFGMTELSTCFNAVNSDEVKGKVTADKVIKKLKEKLSKCNRSLSVVIRDTRSKNLDLETWLISSLII